MAYRLWSHDPINALLNEDIILKLPNNDNMIGHGTIINVELLPPNYLEIECIVRLNTPWKECKTDTQNIKINNLNEETFWLKCDEYNIMYSPEGDYMNTCPFYSFKSSDIEYLVNAYYKYFELEKSNQIYEKHLQSIQKTIFKCDFQTERERFFENHNEFMVVKNKAQRMEKYISKLETEVEKHKIEVLTKKLNKVKKHMKKLLKVL